LRAVFPREKEAIIHNKGKEEFGSGACVVMGRENLKEDSIELRPNWRKGEGRMLPKQSRNLMSLGITNGYQEWGK
jgi:hypothetical protein